MCAISLNNSLALLPIKLPSSSKTNSPTSPLFPSLSTCQKHNRQHHSDPLFLQLPDPPHSPASAGLGLPPCGPHVLPQHCPCLFTELLISGFPTFPSLNLLISRVNQSSGLTPLVSAYAHPPWELFPQGWASLAIFLSPQSVTADCPYIFYRTHDRDLPPTITRFPQYTPKPTGLKLLSPPTPREQ